jgi:uridylate kinase
MDILTKDLKVMDATAVSLARENKIPVMVFSIREPGNFAKVMGGEGEFTIVSDEK